jgi:hypothetical protein
MLMNWMFPRHANLSLSFWLPVDITSLYSASLFRRNVEQQLRLVYWPGNSASNNSQRS